MNLRSIQQAMSQSALLVVQRSHFHVLQHDRCHRSVASSSPSTNGSNLCRRRESFAYPDRLNHGVHFNLVSRPQQSDIILQRYLVEVGMFDNLCEVVAFSTVGAIDRSQHCAQFVSLTSDGAMSSRQKPAIPDDDRTAGVDVSQITERSLEWKLATASLQTTNYATGEGLCGETRLR